MDEATRRRYFNESLEYVDSFEDGPVFLGDLPEELWHRVWWTREQKAAFVHLISLKSRDSIDVIASIVGKSVMECQAYTEILEAAVQLEPNQTPLTYADIPAAEHTEHPEPTPPPSPEDLTGIVESRRRDAEVMNELGIYEYFRAKDLRVTKSFMDGLLHELGVISKQLEQHLHHWNFPGERSTRGGEHDVYEADFRLSVDRWDNMHLYVEPNFAGEESDPEDYFDEQSEDDEQDQLIEQETEYLEALDNDDNLPTISPELEKFMILNRPSGSNSGPS